MVGDFIQLRFLLENLIDEALSVPLGGEIHLAAAVDGEYIRFLFTDMRRTKTREELNQLFYPNLERMTATGEKGELRGTEYLVCKQIIRDHDEFAGKRGCRINAEPAENGGFTVYFTNTEKKIKLKNMEDKKFKVIIVEDVKLELKGTEEIFRHEIPNAEVIDGYDRKRILDIDRSRSS